MVMEAVVAVVTVAVAVVAAVATAAMVAVVTILAAIVISPICSHCCSSRDRTHRPALHTNYSHPVQHPYILPDLTPYL